MCHHDGAFVLGLHFLADQLSDLLATIRVQARARLVCQDQLGVSAEGANDRRPLLLAARHLARILRVGGIDPQIRYEGSYLDLTCGPVLLTLELDDQIELIADAYVGGACAHVVGSLISWPLFGLRSVVRRGVRLLPGLLIGDLDRIRPSG